MRTLQELQRWMQRLIMNPDSVADGLDGARSELADPTNGVETVVTRSRSLSAIQRLEIYRNAYFARLLECLREEFPVLVKFLEEDVFDGFALGYLQAYPSRSYTLAHLAENFPRFLAESRPERLAGEPQPDWADFLIDLAKLEWTFSIVFDGPGCEGEPLLDGDRLREVPSDCWVEARLIPAPCLRLLSLRYPVQDYHAAIRRGESPDLPLAAPTYLAVTRHDYVVRHESLTESEYRVLSALADGVALGPALSLLAETAELPFDQLAEQVHHWFRRWARAGLFRSIQWAARPMP